MTTNQSSVFVRWLVIIVLGAATVGMAAVSLRANYLFGYGFGRTPETAHVFGWANVAADLWKVSGLIVITALWRARQRRSALMLAPIWVLCLVWGLTGAVGVYAQDRTELVGGKAVKVATYKDREGELKEIESKLKMLGEQRDVAQVDAAIESVFARPVIVGERVRGTVGKLSANCTKSERTMAEACAEVAGLREERTAAEKAAQLESERARLRTEIAKLRESGGSLAADPVAELFAWLSRGQLSVRDIGFGFPLFFAFLIEIVSAFGPAGIVAYADATRRSTDVPNGLTQPAMADRGELLLAPAGTGEQGRVVKWIEERTEPTGDPAAITIDNLHADYEVWCLSHGLQALSRDAFAMQFDHVREVPELAGTIRKFGSRYYGIRLLQQKIARLPTRRREQN